uniref:G_PROTEIN_RECEP_F1_2 domain-containing protein n=1 Tax=Panagrellus redivivus TaxID=6233 RepID=A0A7E4VGU4_PANRE
MLDYVDPAVCEANKAIGEYVWMNVVSFADIVFSLLTLVFEIILILKLKSHTIYTHFNFRIIAISFALFFALHSVCILAVQLYNQYEWRFGAPCEAVFARWHCLLFRCPTLLAVIGFSLNHMMFFVDRALATLSPAKYEKTTKTLGIVGVLFFWIVDAIVVYFTIFDNDMDAVYPYCLMTAQASGQRIHCIYISLIALDIAVLIGDAYLRKLSKRRANVRDMNISLEKYALGEQVQLRENQITTAWLFPFAILHVCVFFIFLIATTVYRSIHTNGTMTPQHVAILEGMHGMVCLYGCCANILNLKVYTQLYKERAEKLLVAMVGIDLCADAELYASYFWLNFYNYVSLIFALGTLFVQAISIWYVRKYRVYCHKNFKIIAVSFFLFFTLNSVFVVAMQISRQYTWHVGDCLAVQPRWECLIFRFPMCAAMIGFSLNHLLFFIDRCAATYNPRKYEQRSIYLTLFACVVIWLISIGATYYVIGDNEMNVKYAYCVISVEKTGPRMLVLVEVLMGIDIIALVGDAILRHICQNRISVRQCSISPEQYALSEQVQIRENQITTAWLFPFAILHVTLFLGFLLASMIYRTIKKGSALTPEHLAALENIHMVVFFYVFAANVLNLAVYHKLYTMRQNGRKTDKGGDHGKVYFKMFDQQIQ